MSEICSVTIRMYRHGFGDCFFLQFFAGTKRMQTMLVDCGLKLNDSVSGVTLKDVRDDIAKELRPRAGSKAKPKLDILVVTHEHWDHVSGFDPGLKLYDNFSIGEIWMAWTEDPNDDDAKLLNKGLKRRIKALKIAADRLKDNTKSNAGFYDQFADGSSQLSYRKNFNASLDEVLGFFGPMGIKKVTPSGISVKSKYKVSMDTQKAMDYVRFLAKGQAGIKYYKPGQLIEKKEGLPGVRVFVLGPPKSKLLTKDAPSKGLKKEVYFGDSNAVTGLVDGLLALGDADTSSDASKPFGNVTALSPTDAKNDPFFNQTYFNGDDGWRTIEDDWLDMAGALALQMDSDTNNTSLVLAIELPGGKVLLFPGDAQIGSWLSWHELSWKFKKGSGEEVINATTLLNATVLYKAGHHLSHNATIKDLGLELMTSEGLVALVPEKENQYHGIPFKPLVKALREKTNGRVLFSADSNFDPQETLNNKPDALSAAEWKKFTSNVEVTSLYVQFRVNA